MEKMPTNSPMSPWQTVENYYDELSTIVYANADPRSKDMLFMRRMDGMIVLTICYVAFTIMGPRMMANHKAFDLKWPMVVYNVVMAGFSLWMFLELLVSTWQADYNYFNDDYSKHTSSAPKEVRVVNVMWWYCISKPIEFIDTAFMVLKKKNSQITVLHVWHHAIVFPFIFFATLIGPGGPALFTPLVNCFVHSVMYSYYALSLFPALHPYLGWKKYLTQLQLAQFCIIIFRAYLGMWLGCDYPYLLKYTEVCFVSSLVVLFGNFYIQAYRKRQHGRAAVQTKEANSALRKKDL